MKTIYACNKQNNFYTWLYYLLIIGLVVVTIGNLSIIFGWLPHNGNKLSLTFNIINNIALFVMVMTRAFLNCKKYYVRFDEDKIIFKTDKNKKTEIPYKDIDSHEIHIFEIVFHLKNGKKEVLNLDKFIYENIRKIKETLLKKLG